MTSRRGVRQACIRNSAAVVPIALPTDWSPEQAVAVFEILDQLRERVWDLYGRQSQQVLREQRCSMVSAGTGAGNFDDPDLPF